MILHRTNIMCWPSDLRAVVGATLVVGPGITIATMPAAADTVALGVSARPMLGIAGHVRPVRLPGQAKKLLSETRRAHGVALGSREPPRALNHSLFRSIPASNCSFERSSSSHVSSRPW
jgi:hypothetical protein